MLCCLLLEEAGIAVTEEAEIVVERIVVDGAPVVYAHKCRHQQEQCALRLVEVGNHTANDAILESRRNHQLGTAHICLGVVAVEIVNHILQRFLGADFTRCAVRHPLLHGEHFLVGIGVGFEHLPHIVEAFEGAHARRPHGNSLATVPEQLFQSLALPTGYAAPK